jgi:hypothetical protein
MKKKRGTKIFNKLTYPTLDPYRRKAKDLKNLLNHFQIQKKEPKKNQTGNEYRKVNRNDQSKSVGLSPAFL